MTRRWTGMVGCLLALALFTAGCGGDPETAEAPPPAPELVPPGNDGADDATDTGTTGTDESGPDDSGADGDGDAGAGGGGGGGTSGDDGTGGGGGADAPEDSPENDTPPPAGSPAERAERFCEENPGAC